MKHIVKIMALLVALSASGLAYYRHQCSQRPKLAASLLHCITWMLRSINGGGWTDAISNLPARGNSITRVKICHHGFAYRNSYGDESISLGHQPAHCIIGIPSLPWIDMFVNFVLIAKLSIPETNSLKMTDPVSSTTQ
ncbi:UNVERIFIED_CONTAM: hypothetical protein Scaly_1138700 [Sesamum calycinum]|uniref:Uncharacterized protein n=1 Tax=Sesamum calycinum TaxID=2727403 RepID=A0AAW2QN00_9LAMI